VQVDIAVDKQSLPGNEDVVEHGNGVHLVKATRHRPVEPTALAIKRVPTDEPQARRGHGNGKGQHIDRLIGMRQQRLGKMHHLIAERGESCQHAGTLDDDPSGVFFHHRQMHVRRLLARRRGTSRLDRHQGMGQAQILRTTALIVALHVLSKARLVLGKVRGIGAQAMTQIFM
jgi:hypothetical protein